VIGSKRYPWRLLHLFTTRNENAVSSLYPWDNASIVSLKIVGNGNTRRFTNCCEDLCILFARRSQNTRVICTKSNVILVMFIITKYTEQRPSSEANSHSGSQEIPHLLRNPKVHYHVHKSPPFVPNLSRMYPVNIFSPCFPKIRSNIIFPTTLWSSEWSLPFRFTGQNFELISRHPSHYP